MDCDAEFNALVSMYQSVVHDMKLTYPAWENVAQKAQKLSSQLKSTLICMNAFVDAVQTVGDAANNLKGATRDIGACLTRVCMRQRSIENRLRGLVDSLSDELTVSIQNKGAQWRQRLQDIDRHASKFCRKVRSRKCAVDTSAVNEQRRICQSLLIEQRNQASFFASALLPVLNTELGLLDENNHVRQVTEHLQASVRSVKSNVLIETLLNDIHQGADNSWRSCLSSAANRSSYICSSDSVSVRAPSPSLSTCTWPSSIDEVIMNAESSGPHTISVVEQPKRAVVNANTYSAPYAFGLGKPPLPKRTISSTSSVASPLPESVNDQMYPRNGGALSSSSTDVAGEMTIRRLSRPKSFACDDLSAVQSTRVLINRSSNINNGMRLNRDDSSLQSTNASLIAETIQQIDKLGSELDSYCSAHTHSNVNQTIRFRSGSCRPPPPPERRNSTITAATPTAPSVAELRAASSDYASSIASSSDQYTMRYI